jgi:hypothetical protein
VLCPLLQVRFLQGKQHTWYAGSYTLFNTHEIAVMSGAGLGMLEHKLWPDLQAGSMACALLLICHSGSSPLPVLAALGLLSMRVGCHIERTLLT